MATAKKSDEGTNVSVIERAALRLESLQRTGIAVPWRQEPAPSAPSAEAVRFPHDAAAAQPQVVVREPLQLPVSAPVQPPPMHAVPAAATRRLDIFAPAFVATKRRSVVETARLSAMGYLVAGQDTRSRLAEEFRVIKRPLLQNAADPAVRHGNVVMVTSSVAGEGKTFASINLAMSIATELNRQVVLVEADSARPAVMERLGITADRAGLMDALANPAMSISDIVLPTTIDQLAVIPAGRTVAHATELVASERMSAFLTELAEGWPNRIVILDAPPLLQTTDAREMATHAGQVVLVVESGRTKHALVKQAFAMLERCPVVMSMLNKSPITKGTIEYGYYAY
jgi:receptor protein-tyrosine kinase